MKYSLNYFVINVINYRYNTPCNTVLFTLWVKAVIYVQLTILILFIPEEWIYIDTITIKYIGAL